MNEALLAQFKNTVDEYTAKHLETLKLIHVSTGQDDLSDSEAAELVTQNDDYASTFFTGALGFSEARHTAEQMVTLVTDEDLQVALYEYTFGELESIMEGEGQ